MRDELRLRPVFDAAMVEGEKPLDLRSSHLDPVQPAHTSRAWRIFSFGAVGACALGLGLGLMTLQGQAATKAAKAAQTAASGAYRPINAAYAAPDREQVARALAESDRLMAAEGLSGLARASIVCFDRLEREPGYGLMDYCLALDIYGAQAYAKTAGENAPQSTYFGQGAVRRQTAVQTLIAGQTDANSRIIDTNRLASDVALKTQLAALGVAPAPAEPAPTLTVARIEEPPPAPPPPPAPDPIRSAPEPAPVKAAAPAKTTPKPKPAKPVTVRVAKRAAPLIRQAKAAAPQPAKRERAVVRVKATKKPMPRPVRTLAKREPVKAKPKPKIVAKAAAPPTEPNWPDILLTRLRAEEQPQGEIERPLRRY